MPFFLSMVWKQTRSLVSVKKSKVQHNLQRQENAKHCCIFSFQWNLASLYRKIPPSPIILLAENLEELKHTHFSLPSHFWTLIALLKSGMFSLVTTRWHSRAGAPGPQQSPEKAAFIHPQVCALWSGVSGYGMWCKQFFWRVAQKSLQDLYLRIPRRKHPKARASYKFRLWIPWTAICPPNKLPWRVEIWDSKLLNAICCLKTFSSLCPLGICV